MTQAQKESDILFLKLEEKRMKFDERMMELEDRHLREDKEREFSIENDVDAAS